MKKHFKLLSLVLAALTFMSASSVTFAAPQNSKPSTSKKILKYGLIGTGITTATVLTAVGAYKIFGGKVIEINSEEDFKKINNCKDTITKAIINVKIIPEYAFKDCKNLKEVEFNAVKHVDNAAFLRCESLKTVKNLSGVDFIGEYAFSGCLSLKEIDLSSVMFIQTAAFWGCKSLDKIDLSSLCRMSDRCFSCCSGLRGVILPQNSINFKNLSDFENSILAQTCKTEGEIKFYDE